MAHLIHRLFDWLDHTETRDLERYLAQSANASDLEQRMRHWERTHSGRVYLQ
jgi:hypothetical protein